MGRNFYEHISRAYCSIKGDRRFIAFDESVSRLSWAQDRLHDYQIKRLSTILSWSYQTVDAYRELFERLSILPSESACFEQLILFPILGKEKLQFNLDKYTSRKIPVSSRRLVATGGTTREPVRIWWDLDGFQEATAVQYRTYELVGAGFGTRWVKIAGGLRHLGENQGFRSWAINHLTNRRAILAFEFDDNAIKQWVDTIVGIKPEVIFGYGGHIQMLGEYLKRHPRNLGVKVVLFGGEALPNYREYEPVFHCPVVQTYATREVGVIAFECSERNLHIAEDVVYLEALPDEKQGTSRFLVTSLLNKATPLIRYDIGDCGQILPADCPCGSSFRRLSLDIGRAPQYIRLTNNKTVTHLFFIHAIKDFPVAKYQFVVKNKGKILVKILPIDSSDNLEWESELRKRVLAQLGADLEFDVEYSTEWIVSPTGKILPVVESI